MKLKKSIVFLPVLFIFNYANAAFKVEFLNSTEKKIAIDSILILNMHNEFFLKQGEKFSIYVNEKILFDDLFTVEIIDTHKSCSWIHFLSNRVSHGWGL